VTHSPECTRPDLSGVKFYRLEDGSQGTRCRYCRGCRFVPDPIEPPPRFVLDCVRCGAVIRLHSARRRLPLCDHCRHPDPAGAYRDGSTERNTR
jgi:hypothetical protein